MLTHTDVHYLAAILTQIASPWGVELELGEMVEDCASEEERDVDITVRYFLPDGTPVELHGIEVKDEAKPLSSLKVEGLIRKLQDMPSLTKHALVSASGYTKPAKKKARYHGVELYTFQDWDGGGLPVNMTQLSSVGVIERFWETVTAHPHIPGLPEGTQVPLNAAIRYPHDANLKKQLYEIMNIACKTALEQCSEIREEAEEQIVLSVRVNLEPAVEIDIGGSFMPMPYIGVRGTARFRSANVRHARKALVRASDGIPIAGCFIQELPDGSLFLLLISSTNGSLFGRTISVSARGKNKIYKEKMTPIPKDGPAEPATKTSDII